MIPFFSIIIPLYNKEKHIKATIESVLAQTFQDFEILVVNDGATDKSKIIVEGIRDDRIQIFNIANQGVSHARNYGINKSNSDLIVLLDADDYWLPSHLEDLKWLYETYSKCGLYAKAYAKKDKERIHTSHFLNLPYSGNWHGILDDYFENSLRNSIAWTSSVMIPKSSFEKFGFFNENYTSGEDTDLWIRLALHVPVAFYNKISAYHNLHTENKVTNTPLSTRKLLDLDIYNSAAQLNPSLKKYLDLNRISIALQYKLEGQNELAKGHIKHIAKGNCTTLQRLLLNAPKLLLQSALIIKRLLFQLHVDLRLFR
ncbi:MAG: glycosyltransferase family A protein [Gelidibacter sp.]